MSKEFFIKKPVIAPTIYGVTDENHEGMAKVCYSFLPLPENAAEKILFEVSAFRRDGSLITIDEIFVELEKKGIEREIDQNGSNTNWVKYDANSPWGVGAFFNAISNVKKETTKHKISEIDDRVQQVLLTYDLPRELKASLEKANFDFDKFFTAEGDGDHAKFINKEPVQMLLDFIGGKLEQDQNKIDKTRLPLGDTRLKEILNHIAFVMPNMQACDAMYNFIRKTPYNDPNIETPNDWIKRRFTICRGYNKDGKFYEKELGYIRMAMNGEITNKGQHANEGKDCLGSRTLTITCDDLTTTKNPPEWNGLFVFKNLESFSQLKNQFDAINKSWCVSDKEGNKQSMKPECFVFDFAIDRTLKQLAMNKTEHEVNKLLSDTAVFVYDGVQTKQVGFVDIQNIIKLGTKASSNARKWEIEQIEKAKKRIPLQRFDDTFGYKLIYVFRINDKQHNGLLKIGDATVAGVFDMANFVDNSPLLNTAAKMRIDSYTKTAAVQYELLYTSLAVGGNLKMFRDYDVHNVLFRSGIEKVKCTIVK